MDNLPNFTPEDIIDHLIALIKADPQMQAIVHPDNVLDDDPTNISMEQGTSLAIVHYGDGRTDASISETHESRLYLSTIFYVYDKTRDKAKKRLNTRYTTRINDFIWENRVGTKDGTQLWYLSNMPRDPATLYYTGANFRQSVTIWCFHSRRRNPGSVVIDSGGNPYEVE